MKKSFMILLVGLLVLAVPLIVTAGETLNKVKSEGVLKVATAPSWPPQAFMNDNNELDGFDVDVAKEIAKRLGVKVEFITPDWSIITSGHWNGRWDLSVGSMTPTTKRAEVLNFPAIYYYTVNAFVVHKDSKARKMTDLNGKKIGVAANATSDLYLQKKLVIDAAGAPEIQYAVEAGEIKSYVYILNALDDMRLGDGVRLDGVLGNRNGLQKAIENGYPLRVLDGVAFAEPLSLATDKGDPEFDRKLSELVEAMQADGTMKKFSMKWYSTDNTVAN
jgi:polar amino acid transport system substrate-binding protein